MLNAKIIGSRITEARKKINISQAQLAEQLFISSQAVGKWERGESMPDIVTFTRLAELLHVDLNYFSTGFSDADQVSVESPVAPVAGADNNQPAPERVQKKRGWDMSLGNWVDADFSGLEHLHEKFSGSNMRRCKFIGSDLSGLLLKSNHVDGCDFSGSDINSSEIRNAHLVNNQFKSCSLKDTGFSGSHISGCDFSGADFTGASFKSCDFGKSIVADVTWNGTSFTTSQLTDIVFGGNMEDCYFENCAFSKVTFQNVTLISTFFKCRSLKKVRFIDCKADRLTYEFLKNGKAELSGVTLITQP
ncbi:pentapeptide repeat-containing protein [Niabella beijingensis]|uniref:pentapeptide repeat-containing protein n=1 Tax=Niabella beijingensis TaxID=2872700 RepID=UPI001CC1349B|nr:pentapeptide repeat-containing protein [Niabella beijingensis]MBZ4190060.1 pentapeptide repeat-containing protein [Niabella beijingensis]